MDGRSVIVAVLNIMGSFVKIPSVRLDSVSTVDVVTFKMNVRFVTAQVLVMLAQTARLVFVDPGTA